MVKSKILKSVVLNKKHHQATDNTKHYVGGEVMRKPYQLRIVRYENDDGCYLFYCDEKGEELSDTYHDSIDQAQAQASWEFTINPSDWVNED